LRQAGANVIYCFHELFSRGSGAALFAWTDRFQYTSQAFLAGIPEPLARLACKRPEYPVALGFAVACGGIISTSASSYCR
jgi:hypothetical protein